MDRIVIIGGGLGGLTTGALLSKEGYEVTVLEKNSTIGGGLQTFCRAGMLFETGMHLLGGFEEGGSLSRICNYLGILDKIDIVEVDRNCSNIITYLNTGEVYRIGSKPNGFIESFAERFPHQRENLKAYIDAMFRMAEEFKLFNLQPTGNSIQQHSEEFMWPADKFISHYITDPKLADILAFMAPLYSGAKGETPAYIHSLINILYIKGTYRFRGGSQQMADALAEVIVKNGGRVIPSREVIGMNVEEKRITEVTTKNGSTYTADWYISATDLPHLMDIVGQGALPKAYRERIKSIPVSYSVFTLFVEFKPESFPYLNCTCYIQNHWSDIWDPLITEKGPNGLMYMTPPDRNQGKYASRMIVNCPMSFADVQDWRDTYTGRRGEAYYAWKERITEKIISYMERVIPGLKGCIKNIWSASPLTIRDWYNNKEGGLYGFRKDCNNMIVTQIPLATKIRNLLLTGQGIGLHGICGVPLSAILTAEALVGRDKIIKRINEAYK